MNRTLFILLVLLFLLSAQSVVFAQRKRLIGNIIDRNVIENVCTRGGWDFTRYYSLTKANEKAKRFIFFENGEPNSSETNAWMNIDGKDIKLKRVKETYSKNGHSSLQEFISGGVTVDINQAVIGTRDGFQNLLSATFIVQQGDLKQVVHAVGTSFSCK